MKPEILVCVPHNAEQLALFEARFTTHYAPTPDTLAAVLSTRPEAIRGVVTTGAFGFTRTQMEQLPGLEIVAVRGAGTDNVDFEAARRLRIAVCNCPAVNFFAVAEHAVALLLSLVRWIPFDNQGVHQGDWHARRTVPHRPLVHRKRVGILGLGAVGNAIARRLEGFEVAIAYHNRHPRPDSPYSYVDSVLELARQSDILIISAPGGKETRGLVSLDVLKSLGRQGFLINVGRGSIVDQEALIALLEAGGLAGAAIDVVDGEPDIPQALLEAPNLIITPHVAGNSPETRRAAINAVCTNMEAKFAGRPLQNQLT